MVSMWLHISFRRRAAEALLLAATSVALVGCTAAGTATPSPSNSETPVEAASEAWTDIQKNWIDPLSAPLASLLIAWAAFLVVARVFALLPGKPWSFGGRRRSTGTLISGLALITLPSAISVFYGASNFDTWWVTAAVAIALGLVGSFLVSLYLAGGLRVRASVEHSAGESSAESLELMSYIRELGGANPIGVELPKGSDLTELKGAVSALSERKSVAVVQAGVQWLLGRAPWQISVTPIAQTLEGDEKDNSSALATVLIHRNGRLVSTDQVLLDDVVIDDGTVPPGAALKVSAGIAVAAMASHHPDFAGLYGSRNGVSIGLQYLATTSPGLDDTQIRRLLLRSLKEEPTNALAQASFLFIRWRKSTSPSELAQYLDRLAILLERPQLLPHRSPGLAEGDEGSSEPALRLRLLLTSISVMRNLTAIVPDPTIEGSPGASVARPSNAQSETLQMTTGSPRPRRGYRDFALSSACDLVNGLVAQPDWKEKADEDRFRTTLQMRASVGLRRLRRTLDGYRYDGVQNALALSKGWYQAAKTSEIPNVAYSVACHYVQNRRPEIDSSQPLPPQLEERFRIAFASQELREWAIEDPELSPIRLNPDFLSLVGKSPSNDMWTLAPFTATEADLRAVGILEPSSLARHRQDEDLRKQLRLKRTEFRYLTRAATLVRGAERSGIKRDYLVAIVRGLLEKGVDSPQKLKGQLRRDLAQLEGDLEAAIERAYLPKPALGILKRWITMIAWLG